jgi:DNA repair exonuclease SbcCD ATPase subunit
MTSVAGNMISPGLQDGPDRCARCGRPLPEHRRRTKRYCDKSCCNMTSADRVAQGQAAQHVTMSPFWPHGLEQDFALLGNVRQSVRSVCDELWNMLRRVDSEELAFRRTVESLRTRLTSPDALRSLIESAQQRQEQSDAQHAQEVAQLTREKESAEQLVQAREERCRKLESAFAHAREEFAKREEEQRNRERELKQKLKDLTVERDAATEKYQLLRTEHEHLRSVHDKLADSVTAIQRKQTNKDSVIDVTEQLSIVDKRLKSIHDWVERKTSTQDQQFQLQQTLIEQFSASVAQKLAQRLVIRVDNAGTTARLERLQEAVMSISQQTDWLIHQQQQRPQEQLPQKVNIAPLLDVMKLMYEYMRKMRTELNLEPIIAGMNQLAARIVPPSVDSSVLLAYLQRMEHRLERPSSAPPQPSNASRPPSEKITPLKQQIAALQREVKRLSPLERELQDLKNMYGQARQHLSTLEAQRTAQVATLDGVEKLMLEKIDLQDQIAQFQEVLGEDVTEPALQNRSSQGKVATVTRLLHEARLHILRSPRAFLEPEPCWVEYGVKLDRSSELGLEDQLNADLKRLRKLYAKLYARYHRS